MDNKVSAMTEYLNAISQYPLLTAKEEIALSKKIQSGLQAAEKLQTGYRDRNGALRRRVKSGAAARQKLVESNLKLVVYTAKKYRNRSLSLMDLIQEGNMGLIRAAEKYDYTLGNRFSTYAIFWIEQAIVTSIEQNNPIRLPTHMAETTSKIRKTYQKLTLINYHEPTPEELSLELKLPLSRINELLALALQPVSLDVETESGSTLGDLLESPTPTPEDETVERDIKDSLAHILRSALSENEQKVIYLRFGFRDGREWSKSEVGEAMGVSRQRVAQIEERAMEKLRMKKYQPKLLAMC